MRPKVKLFLMSIAIFSLAIVPFWNPPHAQASDANWQTKASLPAAMTSPNSLAVNGKIYTVSKTSPSVLYVYNPQSNTWATKPTPPLGDRYGMASAVIGDNIYLLGGVDHGGPLSTVSIYDTVNETWSNGASMIETDNHASAEVVNGKIYVMGGTYSYSNNPGSKKNQIYDPIANSWSLGAEMPTSRMGLLTAAVNGKIYAMGGGQWGGSAQAAFLTVVEEYDPTTDSWATKTPMPTARTGGIAVPYGGKIYVIGGYNKTDGLPARVDVYDPSTDSWGSTTAIPTPRSSMGDSTESRIGNTIYAIGGEDFGGYLTSVEALTITENSCSQNPQDYLVYDNADTYSTPSDYWTLDGSRYDYESSGYPRLDGKFISFYREAGFGGASRSIMPTSDVTVSYSCYLDYGKQVNNDYLELNNGLSLPICRTSCGADPYTGAGGTNKVYYFSGPGYNAGFINGVNKAWNKVILHYDGTNCQYTINGQTVTVPQLASGPVTKVGLEGEGPRGAGRWGGSFDNIVAYNGTSCPVSDQDGDGYTVAQGDCNDNNANIHPGALESCNGLDDNCDGIIDNSPTALNTSYIPQDFCSGWSLRAGDEGGPDPSCQTSVFKTNTGSVLVSRDNVTRKMLSTALKGNIQFDAWVLPTDVGANMGISLGNWQTSKEAIVLGAADSSRWQYAGPPDGSYVYIGPISHSWTKVKILIDTNASTYSLWLDGVQKLSNIHTVGSITGGIDVMGLSSGRAASAQNSYIDDINLREVNTGAGALCDDGIFCNGQETCGGTQGCMQSAPIDCSANNLPVINSCYNNPDYNPYTLDYFAGYTATCNESAKSCTTGKVEIAHTCSVNQCGAQCDASHGCAATDCSHLNGCYNGVKRIYLNAVNTCTDGCTCTQNQCGVYDIASTDADLDGYNVECQGDCNDSNAAINPGEFEMPGNSIDENCDEIKTCDSKAVWKNHGEYVSCVTKAANDLMKAGLITGKQKGEKVSNAAQSDVGKK